MKTEPHASATSTVGRESVIRALRREIPADSVLTEPEQLTPFECDGLTAYRCRPWIVVIPNLIAEVQAVLRICREHAVPVVVRGAGTGLSGGALPLVDGVLLVMSKFKRILEIDPFGRTARVEPGVRNLAITDSARQYGLYYAPDPSSQIACTIGGNIAENSGGVHCLKYGLTVHNVLQIKVITIHGEELVLGSHGLDGPGYDFGALICGSEGLLGVVVEATVRLLPTPESVTILLVTFASIADAGAAVAAIIAAGLIPAGLEMMDNVAIRAAESFLGAGYPVDAASILLCELDGTKTQVDADLATARRIFSKVNATSVRVATDAKERSRFWAGRKAAFPAVGRIAPDYYCMDGTIPRKRLADVLTAIGALSERYELPVANVFHAGDGNLHPLILFDANKPGDLAKAEAFGAEILTLCVAAGGTVTGEHGVGIEKLDQMCLQFDTPELELMHELKQAFDPAGLLNPGKAIPTLHRCAELGRMHVHAGTLPFPELDRF